MEMFERVLVPIDFSKYSHKLLECLCDIPGLKEIVLLNVLVRNPAVEIWNPATLVADAQRRLMEESKSIALPDIGVKAKAAISFEGDVSGIIRSVAEEENVDLVVMGARGMGIVRSAILGSSSRNVLRFGDKNLLIMRYKLLGSLENGTFERYCAHIFSKVLVPMDLSKSSETALFFLRGIPGIGEIVLLYVMPQGETKDETGASTSGGVERLESFSQELRRYGLKAKARFAVGNPVERIGMIADEEDVSLIAMSSHGRNSSKTGRIGSAAYDVANTLDRPVLIIRTMPQLAFA